MACITPILLRTTQLLGSEFLWSYSLRCRELPETNILLLPGSLSLFLLAVHETILELQDDSIDVFPISFLNVFFGTGGAPSINLANVCSGRCSSFIFNSHCTARPAITLIMPRSLGPRCQIARPLLQISQLVNPRGRSSLSV